jgi:hypothetical protein
MKKQRVILDQLSSKELLELLDKALFAGTICKKDKTQKYIDLQHKIVRVIHRVYPEVYKKEGFVLLGKIK